MKTRRLDKERVALKLGEIQRKNGLYAFRYNSGDDGSRQTIYDRDLASLRRREEKIRRDVSDGIITNLAKRELTLNELFTRYMRSRKLSPTTRGNYLAMWKSLVEGSLGKMKVVTIKKSNIRLFYANLGKEGYSHNTIKLLHAMIYPCLEQATDDDLIRKNPAKNVLGDMGVPPTERTALTVEQEDKLIDFAKDSNVYNVYVPMLQIMLGTALRCGELLGLTWKDVSLENGEISIDHQLVYKDFGNDCHEFHICPPKTAAGIRKIPMSETVRAAFAQQRKYNFLRGLNNTYTVDGYNGFIFMSKSGRPLQLGAVNNVLYNIVEKYNKKEIALSKEERREPQLMPAFSAHTLRHTACTRMAESGMDLKVLQYIMGHEKVNITMDVYNHIEDVDRVKKEFEKIKQGVV